MPIVTVNWLQKSCRTPDVKRKVADAIIDAMSGVEEAEVSPDRVSVKFSIIDNDQPDEGYRVKS